MKSGILAEMLESFVLKRVLGDGGEIWRKSKWVDFGGFWGKCFPKCFPTFTPKPQNGETNGSLWGNKWGNKRLKVYKTKEI